MPSPAPVETFASASKPGLVPANSDVYYRVVDAPNQYFENAHTVWERSKEWPTSWGFTDAWVREALADAVPRERKITLRPRPKLEAAVAFIEAILEGGKSMAALTVLFPASTAPHSAA